MSSSEIEPLDQLFAKTLLQKVEGATEDQERFLATLMHLSRKGHLSAALSELGLPDIPFPETLVEEGRDLFPKAPIVHYGGHYYLQKNWVYETYILEQLQRLLSISPPPLFDRALFEEQLAQEKHLFPEQAEALRELFNRSFSILCGGPGTGKSHTAVTYIRLLLASLPKGETLHLCLSAPTGKAALHLQSLLTREPFPTSLHVETMTLHRLLKLQPRENHLFSGKRIDADLIIVDEASMIALSLLAHLLEAVGNQSRLLLLGDPDQLPPVESCSLFGEMARLWGTSLRRCVRTEDGPLRDLAEAVRQGEVEQMLAAVEPLPWAFDSSLVEHLYHYLQPLFSWERPDPEAAFRYYASRRVITPLRQGPYGVEMLNRQLFQLMEAKMQKEQWWALPILVRANDSFSGLYNGTQGVLIGQKPQGLHEALAYFPEHSQEPFSILPPFELAFCLSVHKSQGSEFEELLALFPPGSDSFGKESLYTAITRAKRQFKWVGREETLRTMLLSTTFTSSSFSERAREVMTYLQRSARSPRNR